MNRQLKEIKDLRGFVVEWAGRGDYYLSRRDIVFHSPDLKPPFKRLAQIEAPFWKRIASRFRLGQRLLRFMVTNIIPLSNGDLFVTFDKSVGVIRKGVYFSLAGLERPCRVLRSACALDGNGDIFFGEYLDNAGRGPMRVYRYSQGDDEMAVAFTFPAGSIRHVHGIYRDDFTDDLYCLTGDAESECRILRTSDKFQTMETVGEGDETWRAVSMVFTEDSIYYGTDAEYRTNQIYRIDRKTGERESLGEINGTVFYSKRIGEDLYFTTTAENAPAQTENVASIWCLRSTGELIELAKFKKDMWHPTLFQFGTIHIPNSASELEEFIFHIVAAKGDGKTFHFPLTVMDQP